MSSIHQAPDQGLQARHENLSRDGLASGGRDNRSGERHGESRSRFEAALHKAQGRKAEERVPLAIAEPRLFDLFRPQAIEPARQGPQSSAIIERIVMLTADLAASAGQGPEPAIRQMRVTLEGTGLAGLGIRLDAEGLDLTLLTVGDGLHPSLAAATAVLASAIQSRLGCRRVRIFEQGRGSA